MRWLPAVLSVCALSAQTLTTRNFGGSGSDTISGVALDAGGNIWVAGTTTSFDLPLLHATQSTNNGTSLAYSTDSGLTWKPLCNPVTGFQPSFATVPFAVDPTNASVLYIGTYGNVLKSTDGGKTFAPLSIGATAIVIDPTAPQTIYAGVSGTGVFKSTDGGATWNPAITVKSGGAVSNTLIAEVVTAAPGLLSADGSGTGPANARNDDGELNSPTHPAALGSTVTLYLTGVGNPAPAIKLLTSDGETAPLILQPLRGFVPGIYAGSIQAPDKTSQVSLFATYLSTMPYPTQSLTIYVGN